LIVVSTRYVLVEIPDVTQFQSLRRVDRRFDRMLARRNFCP
jgi:hypothetical protein